MTTHAKKVISVFVHITAIQFCSIYLSCSVTRLAASKRLSLLSSYLVNAPSEKRVLWRVIFSNWKFSSSKSFQCLRWIVCS